MARPRAVRRGERTTVRFTVLDAGDGKVISRFRPGVTPDDERLVSGVEALASDD